MDCLSDHYISDVASAVAAVLGSRLVGVYLHGSAVLGGFDAQRHRRPCRLRAPHDGR
ncbi:hypothetical protein ABZU32_27340 [Sphaerisporangium sp. NPDC005288]|uniref:hypothetical protein n=1 Tax=Sphaerisporangium sp. NPDC005288 TaxID=3155114 RepID=UPI0033BBEF91